jgi:hypothetical protein
VSLALVLVLVLDLFFGFFGLPTCIPSDPVYHLVMCNTITSASPSHNPCSLCVLDNESVTYRAWDQALRDASLDGSVFRDLCIAHKEEVEEWEEAEVDEDDGGPDGPPVDHDGEAFYEGDDWH